MISHGEPFAPSILVICDSSDLAPQLPMGVAVQNARNCIQLPLRDPDDDLRIPSDVLDPSDGFATFDEQVEPFAAHTNQISISRRRPALRPMVVRHRNCASLYSAIWTVRPRPPLIFRLPYRKSSPAASGRTALAKVSMASSVMNASTVEGPADLCIDRFFFG